MCYYNGTKVTRGEFLRLKHLERLVAEYDFLKTPLYVGTDYVQAPVMRKYPKKDDFELAMKDWGILPPNIQTDAEVAEFRIKWMTLNAKVENLFISETGGYSMFAEAAAQRRCLIPSTHFFEMRHINLRGKNGRVLKSVAKYPYLIRLKEQEIYYFAGLWNPNPKRGSNWAIVTAPATHELSLIHNTKKRMPCILTEELAWEWMFNPKLTRSEIQDIGGFQFPANKMMWYTVDRDLFNCADAMKEVTHEEMPPLGVDVMIDPQMGLF